MPPMLTGVGEEMTEEDLDALFEDDDAETESEVDKVDDAESDNSETGEAEKSEAEKSEEEEAGPPPEKPKSVPIAALLDERRKREELKKEVEALRKQVPKVDEAPDMYDDPEGYKQWVKDEAKRELLESQQAEQAELIEESRSEMLGKHDDYEEMETIFSVLAAKDQSLADEMIKNPRTAAQFAYEKGKAFMESLKVKANPVETSEKEDVLSEAEQRLKSAIKAPKLSTATSTASNSTEVEQEEDLMEMFSDQTY